jgi:hypothetical protein
MGFLRNLSLAVGLLALCVVAVGCATTTPDPGSGVSPPQPVSPLATSTAVPTATPVPTPTPTAAPVQMVILHTNDNWGETEPCG